MLTSKRKILNYFSAYISKPKARFYKKYGLKIVMGEREGVRFTDVNGDSYINCHCNGGVFNLGHKNPYVMRAVREATQHYDIGNHHLPSSARSELARELIRSMPRKKAGFYKGKAFHRVIFAVSGGEAADTAIKLARASTGRRKIVSLQGAYHGHTGLAVATGDLRYSLPFLSASTDFVQIPHSDIAAAESSIDSDTAAVIIETCPATLGMVVFPSDYIQHLASLCKKSGAVLIMDEIQTGWMRTGKLWGFEHYGVTPDIVIAGKGMSGGVYPIAAVIMHKQFESVFKDDPFIHISTFGGAELGCVAALETLRISRSKELEQNVSDISDFYRSELNRFADEYQEIESVRQLGLFIGIVMKDEATAILFVKAMIECGVFVVYANNDKRVVQFLPPLIMNRKDAEITTERIVSALKKLKSLKYKMLRKAYNLIS